MREKEGWIARVAYDGVVRAAVAETKNDVGVMEHLQRNVEIARGIICEWHVKGRFAPVSEEYVVGQSRRRNGQRRCARCDRARWRRLIIQRIADLIHPVELV